MYHTQTKFAGAQSHASGKRCLVVNVLEATFDGVCLKCFVEEAVDFVVDVNRAKVVMAGQGKGVGDLFGKCLLFSCQ